MASFGSCSRTTDAAIVRGISEVFSSVSAGTSGGDAEDEVEAILPALSSNLTPVDGIRYLRMIITSRA